MTERLRPKKLRPDKDLNILEKVRGAINKGLFRDTRHSLQRGIERQISLPEVIEVLETGFHEKRKDEYRSEFRSWNYAIRGETFEGKDLRVAVYFESETVMIATVIRPDN